MQDAGKAHEGTVHGTVFPEAQLDLVVFRRQLAADGLQPAPQAVAVTGSLQGEVEVLGIARQAEQKAQGGSPVKGQRRHRSGPLQRPQNACLQVLARSVPSPQRPEPLNELRQVILHNTS